MKTTIDTCAFDIKLWLVGQGYKFYLTMKLEFIPELRNLNGNRLTLNYICNVFESTIHSLLKKSSGSTTSIAHTSNLFACLPQHYSLIGPQVLDSDAIDHHIFGNRTLFSTLSLLL